MTAVKTKFKSIIRAAYDSFRGTVFAGTVLLTAFGTQAQSLFVSDFETGDIYGFTPSGTQSTFACLLYTSAQLTSAQSKACLSLACR